MNIAAALLLLMAQILPGNATQGDRLLFEKGCLDCHGLNGSASDLSRTPRHAVTPELLPTEMWNHMMAMRTKPATSLTSGEAADLFAYLYSVLYFSLPGNVARGKTVFERKNCANCHNDIATWDAVADPVMWAERMWNHSPDMNAAVVKKGFQWPILSSQDVADLMIYFRSIPELRWNSASFRIGEPQRGHLVFERSCESCHSFGPRAGNSIDLLSRAAPLTVTSYIAAMWNHARTMQARSGKDFPILRSGEMSDLIAFLFSEWYFFQRGDAVRGRRVFTNKGCARCHEERRQETGAPDLARALKSYSPITLTAAVWRHAPAMSEEMRRDRIPWREFQDSEMADLIAYLNSL